MAKNTSLCKKKKKSVLQTKWQILVNLPNTRVHSVAAIKSIIYMFPLVVKIKIAKKANTPIDGPLQRWPTAKKHITSSKVMVVGRAIQALCLDDQIETLHRASLCFVKATRGPSKCLLHQTRIMTGTKITTWKQHPYVKIKRPLLACIAKYNCSTYF